MTGTSSRTAPFLVSDTGTISGVVSGSSFTLQWETTTGYGGSSACRVVTTLTTGMLTIADGSMKGVLRSTPQPPCSFTVIGGRTVVQEALTRRSCLRSRRRPRLAQTFYLRVDVVTDGVLCWIGF